MLLFKSFLIQEFREETFFMNVDKCSRPDGFNPGIYKKKIVTFMGRKSLKLVFCGLIRVYFWQTWTQQTLL